MGKVNRSWIQGGGRPSICHWHFRYRPCLTCQRLVAEHNQPGEHVPDEPCPACEHEGKHWED